MNTETREIRRQANETLSILPSLNKTQLLKVARIIRANVGERVKGGAFKTYDKERLAREIRRVIGRGTFNDTLVRFVRTVNEV